MSLAEFTIEIDSELLEQFKAICTREDATPEQVIAAFIEFVANENNKDIIKQLLSAE